jgi:hypothetical protein
VHRELHVDCGSFHPRTSQSHRGGLLGGLAAEIHRKFHRRPEDALGGRSMQNLIVGKISSFDVWNTATKG